MRFSRFFAHLHWMLCHCDAMNNVVRLQFTNFDAPLRQQLHAFLNSSHKFPKRIRMSKWADWLTGVLMKKSAVFIWHFQVLDRLFNAIKSNCHTYTLRHVYFSFVHSCDVCFVVAAVVCQLLTNWTTKGSRKFLCWHCLHCNIIQGNANE